jgi:2-keto-4-pentenoate hydratase/2-oxohepta-3-ene-1,7-dioic acid hydratase in catechol pathway
VRLVRFTINDRINYGCLEDGIITPYRDNPFGSDFFNNDTGLATGSPHRLEDVRLLSPCVPSKIVCLGLNYRTHAEEVNLRLPAHPLIFLKPATSVIGTEDHIIFPPNYTRVDYEAELAVVIGKKAKMVPESDAMEYILGYTCLNDVTERDQQSADRQWTRAKGYDTFAPIGPWIETSVDPANLKIELYLNNKCMQSSNTRELLFDIPVLISFISGVMTLLPGDVIATGTPAGISPMQPGDTVEVRIENIGTLRNYTRLQS